MQRSRALPHGRSYGQREQAVGGAGGRAVAALDGNDGYRVNSLVVARALEQSAAMNQTSLALASLTALTMLGAACGDPETTAPTPVELRTQLRADLGHILDETAAAVEAGETALPNTAVLEMLTSALPTEGALTGAKVRDGLARILPADPIDEDPLNSDAAIDWLEQNLFTDANHLGGGIYEVPASLVCTTSIYDETTGESTESVDAACAADFEQVQLRIRVTSDDDELSFAIQLGADHAEPIVVGLARTRVSLSVDLDEAMAAAAQLAPLFGEELPNLDFSGQVTSALEVLGEDHAKATFTIDRALRVRFAEAGVALDGPDAFRFASAASTLFTLEFDAPADVGSAALALGETSLYEPEEQLALDLPGITGTAALASGQPLRITGISLGDRTTTLTKAGAQALGIDLNPADGRALDVTITAEGDDAATLAVSPRLDLRVALDHTVRGTEREVYDVTRIQLDGTLRGEATSSQIEIVDGTFAITTDPVSYGFSATGGQCVSSSEQYDDVGGWYYEAFTVGACL